VSEFLCKKGANDARMLVHPCEFATNLARKSTALPTRPVMRQAARVEIVEVLRALAALSVKWFHLTNQYAGWVADSGSLGWLGVEVFFVISGFVVPLSIAIFLSGTGTYTMRSASLFLARRITRLEPPYILSVLLVVSLGFASSLAPGFAGAAPEVDFLQLVSHLIYIAPLVGEDWLQPVYWTLAYEFVFYVSMAILFPFVAVSGRALGFALFAFVLLVGCWVGAVPSLALLFIVGIAVYRCFWLKDGTFSGCLVAIFALIVIALKGQGAAAIVGGVTGLLIIGARAFKFGTGYFSRALIWLASISYSLYLLHVPIGGRVVNLGRRWIEGPWQELALSLLALVICLVAAWVFHKVVEVPAHALSRRVKAPPTIGAKMQTT
jgi:peptidoglycan/LPS O-acetylase OafA/YrhL